MNYKLLLPFFFAASLSACATNDCHHSTQSDGIWTHQHHGEQANGAYPYDCDQYEAGDEQIGGDGEHESESNERESADEHEGSMHSGGSHQSSDEGDYKKHDDEHEEDD